MVILSTTVLSNFSIDYVLNKILDKLGVANWVMATATITTWMVSYLMQKEEA